MIKGEIFVLVSILKWNYEWKIKGVFIYGVINDKKIIGNIFLKIYM